MKKRYRLLSLFGLYIYTTIVYVGLTALNALVFWTPDKLTLQLRQGGVYVLTTLFVCITTNLLLRKTRFSEVSLYNFAFLAILVASILKYIVQLPEFSIAYGLLIIFGVYITIKEEL